MLMKRQYGGGVIETKTLTVVPYRDYNFGRVWMIEGDNGYRLAMYKNKENAYAILEEAIHFVTVKGNDSYLFSADLAGTVPPWESGDSRTGEIQ